MASNTVRKHKRIMRGCHVLEVKCRCLIAVPQESLQWNLDDGQWGSSSNSSCHVRQNHNPNSRRQLNSNAQSRPNTAPRDTLSFTVSTFSVSGDLKNKCASPIAIRSQSLQPLQSLAEAMSARLLPCMQKASAVQQMMAGSAAGIER